MSYHDAACESELTSHGYTPCRCGERADPSVQTPEQRGTCAYCHVLLIVLDEPRRFTPAAPRNHQAQTFTYQCPQCGVLYYAV